MMNDKKAHNMISLALQNNYDIVLLSTNLIDYQLKKLIWNNNEYYIKNIKIDYINKEIKNYINNNKNSFIKLIIKNTNDVDNIFLNIPWDIVDKNKLVY